MIGCGEGGMTHRDLEKQCAVWCIKKSFIAKEKICEPACV